VIGFDRQIDLACRWRTTLPELSLLRMLGGHLEFFSGGPASARDTDPVARKTAKSMANLPPLPPAGRAPQGGQSAATGKSNPKDSRAGTKRGGAPKQSGVNKTTQSNRKQGDR
jgi:hypothetical protein